MEKTLPFNKEKIKEIAAQYPTPFHLYDEQGIRNNMKRLKKAFAWAPSFKEYFAVKAAPNPYLLKLLQEEGAGADCSSLAELILCEKVGIKGEEIMFSSNNTPAEEYQKAAELGAIINLDDISHIEFLEECVGIPEMISFRYNPGPLRAGNAIIGTPEEAKYGLTGEQIITAFKTMKDKGSKRFGLHTMVISNELNPDFFVETAVMMFDLIKEIKDKTGVEIELVNFGGGIGIPYLPEQDPVDLEYLGGKVQEAYESKIKAQGLQDLTIALECGRMITGPYGYLVTQAIHSKDIYKKYIGVDACMADLMRPGMYGSYHHITVLGKEQEVQNKTYDVTGGLCENCDKFAIDRKLPEIQRGDYLVIHDTGAHGHAMGFNYNGKLRSAEILLQKDGGFKLIRRAETLDDLFATLDFSEF